MLLLTHRSTDHQRWEQLFTLSGSGFFAKGKFEPLWAYAYSAKREAAFDSCSILLARVVFQES